MSQTLTSSKTSQVATIDRDLYEAGIRYRQVEAIYPCADGEPPPVNIVNHFLTRLRLAVKRLPAGPSDEDDRQVLLQKINRAEGWWDDWVSSADYRFREGFEVELGIIRGLLSDLARSWKAKFPLAESWLELGMLIVRVEFDERLERRRRNRIEELLSNVGWELHDLCPEIGTYEEGTLLPKGVAEIEAFTGWFNVEMGLRSLVTSNNPGEARNPCLRIDLETQMVFLDGVRFLIEDRRSILVFKAIVDAKGLPVPGPDLRSLPSCKGISHFGRLLEKHLPKVLQKMIGRRKGKGGGYKLLPQK